MIEKEEEVEKSAYEDFPGFTYPTEKGTLGFSLYSKEEPSPVGAPKYFTYAAKLHNRAIWYVADSPAQAIANMLHGVAQLARDGSLDPSEPERIGCPPIQHVMNILSDRLAWFIARRRESCEDLHSSNPGPRFDHGERVITLGDQQGRHNEVISALGTAISALARIKDL